jgi:hypothetical protein
MSRFKSLIIVLALLFSPVLLLAQGVNVTGDWEMTVTSPRGERTQDIHFDQQGENLTVTTTTQRGDKIEGKGTVKGNEIEWTFTISTQRGEFTQTFKGKIEGDTMSGEVQMGDFGSMPWKAKKK